MFRVSPYVQNKKVCILAEGSVQTEFFDTTDVTAGLRARVVRGGFWVFALRITNRLLGLARIIILARLLAPADFGLFGIALLAMSALETFSQTGFSAALIQKKQDTKSYLDTAWTVQVIRGVVLALVAFVISPYVAGFFDAPAAKPILQVIGLSVLLQGFTNIGVVYFQKELEFHKQFAYMFSGTLVDLSVAVTAAFLLKNVWALVYGLLAGAIVRLIVSYIIHPYRPRLGFNRQQFKELFGFGKWILGSSIIIFLLTQGDDALVGKVLGVTALGFYQLAYRLSNMPATEITHVISQVTFPAYSKLQDNLPRLREAYLKVLQLTAFLSFPVAGLIFLLAGDFTKIFLGEKWMPMVPIMQALCIFGVTRSVNGTMGSFFQGIGTPRINTITSGIQLIIMAIIIYPLAMKWNIFGVCLAVIIPNAFALIYLGRKLLVIIDYGLRYVARLLFFPIIGTIGMCLVILPVRIWGETGLSKFFISILLGIGTYLGAMYLIDRTSNYNLRNNIVRVPKAV